MADSSDYAEMRAAVGVKVTTEDLITATQLQRLNVTLNRRDAMPKQGDPVPWGWHSIYFPRLAITDRLNPDGVAPDFEGAPGNPLPRRMYAGNNMRFHEPLRVGDHATREYFIKSVTPKEGRSGKLVFVTAGLRILGPRGLALEDDQNMVFREEERSDGKTAPPPTEPARMDAPWKRTITIDEVMLFRFSAVTFNAHRIHYDHPYVTQVEKYPDLLIHGPFTAVLLLELVREHWPDKAMRMTGFRMQAKTALFAHRPILLLGEPAADGKSCRLWAADEKGSLAMEIAAEFN